MLRNPQVLVVSVVLAMTTITQGYLDPTIEPHFRNFGLTPQFVGLVFLAESVAYAIASPLVGWASGKLQNKSPMMIFGNDREQ